MRTWLGQWFGLTIPVVAAPMAGVSTGRLAAAVSAAGGFGMLGVGPTSTPEWVREQCAVAREAGRFGIGLMAWALAQNDALVDVIVAEAPALVSVSYGPYERWIPPLQDAGIVVATQVGTLGEAVAAEQAGVDVAGRPRGRGRRSRPERRGHAAAAAGGSRRGGGPGPRGRWHRHGSRPGGSARRRCGRCVGGDCVSRLH